MAQQTKHTDAEQAAIDRARGALEARQEWVDGMSVESVTPVQWPDASLGCRRPGVSYVQVIMPGYTVRFTSKDVRREVHVSGDRTAVCGGNVDADTLKRPSGAVPLKKLTEMIEKSRADLAMRLGGNVDEVTVVSALPVRLPARELRCEGGKAEANEHPVPGFRIELAYKARNYIYRSDMENVTACPRIEAK